MTTRRSLQWGAAILAVAGVAWVGLRGLDRLVGGHPEAQQTAGESAAPPAGVPRITATLFYGSADGEALIPVRREVALADGIVPQAREILAAQLQGAAAPYLSVIPEGTKLRAFYVTDRGDAFVDLTGEVSSAHPGGSSTEMLTVFAIVNAVTANLPTIQRVQILVDGQEVDTLAGHVDLRRPLERDESLLREER